MLKGYANGFLIEVSLKEYPEMNKKYLRIHDLRESESYFNFTVVDNAFDALSTSEEVSYNFWSMYRSVYRDQVGEIIAKAFGMIVGIAAIVVDVNLIRVSGNIPDLKVIKVRGLTTDIFFTSNRELRSRLVEERREGDMSYLMTGDVNHTAMLAHIS